MACNGNANLTFLLEDLDIADLSIDNIQVDKLNINNDDYDQMMIDLENPSKASTPIKRKNDPDNDETLPYSDTDTLPYSEVNIYFFILLKKNT